MDTRQPSTANQLCSGPLDRSSLRCIRSDVHWAAGLGPTPRVCLDQVRILDATYTCIADGERQGPPCQWRCRRFTQRHRVDDAQGSAARGYGGAD
eukprot:scaffold286027_cov39-Prasinocladus_malaysianus.AAC.1